MKEILPRYWSLTGDAPLPPKWSVGFWISKISYRTQREVELLMDKFRERDISTSRFEDPKAMLDKAREKGFHMTLWQMPYIENSKEHPNPVFEEGFRKEYFAYREDGNADFAHGLIDFSNPEAVKWYQEKLLRPLLEMGVAGIKADFWKQPFYRDRRKGNRGRSFHGSQRGWSETKVLSEQSGTGSDALKYSGKGCPAEWGGDFLCAGR